MTPPTTPIDSELDLADPQVQAALQSDAELLDLYVLGGQKQALLTLLARFTPMMTGVIRRVVSHAEDAEDAFQATCLVLMQSAKKIRSRSSIAAWLYGVAYRTACRVRAKSRRQATGLDPLEVPDGNVNDNLIDQLVRQIELSNLDRELQNLPDTYRDPLVEHYILGLSARQVAERMGLSISAVEGRLKRGRQMLRERLAVRGASLSVCVAGVARMRDHRQTAELGQELSSHFTNSPAFQSPESLSERDPYLFELVEGETKMHAASILKSASFFGAMAMVTVSLSVIALAVQGLDDGRAGAPQAQGSDSNASGVQAVPAPKNSAEEVAVTFQENRPAARPNGPQPGQMINRMLGRDTTNPEVIKFVKPQTPTPNWMTAGESGQAETEKVRDMLRQEIDADFVGVQLSDVLGELGAKYGVKLHLTKQAIERLGDDFPVSCTVQQMPMHDVLNMILDPLQLTYRAQQKMVSIVNIDDTNEPIRYYDLAHVLPNSAGVPSLTQTGLMFMADDSNDPSISVVGSMMVVRCSERSHLKMERLLAEIARLSPENLPINDSQAKGGGVIAPQGPAAGIGGGMF